MADSDDDTPLGTRRCAVSNSWLKFLQSTSAAACVDGGCNVAFVRGGKKASHASEPRKGHAKCPTFCIRRALRCNVHTTPELDPRFVQWWPLSAREQERGL